MAPAQILSAVELVPGVPSREVGRGGAPWSGCFGLLRLPAASGRTNSEPMVHSKDKAHRETLRPGAPAGAGQGVSWTPSTSSFPLVSFLLSFFFPYPSWLDRRLFARRSVESARNSDPTRRCNLRSRGAQSPPTRPTFAQASSTTSVASRCFSSAAASCILLPATRRRVLSLERVSFLRFCRQCCSSEAGSARRVNTDQACPFKCIRWVFGHLSLAG